MTLPASRVPLPGRVAVIGAGTMGHGIAYVAALAGATVTLTDARADALATARKKLEGLFDGAVARGKLTPADRRAAAGRLRVEPDLGAAVATSDVVIEAVVEDLAVKRRLFAEVERLAPVEALLATNTSSLSLTAIAGAVRDPTRVIGLHFFNPVHVMRLVEIVTLRRTDRATADRALALARLLGKEPIIVSDSPG
ncbi:MAG: 3-hydroxyacyl-CoA dehydrogenase family protein, partial [Acidimicrobiales bacterium]